LHPKLETLYPNPVPLNLKPVSLNPTPETLTLRRTPSTRHPTPTGTNATLQLRELRLLDVRSCPQPLAALMAAPDPANTPAIVVFGQLPAESGRSAPGAADAAAAFCAVEYAARCGEECAALPSEAAPTAGPLADDATLSVTVAASQLELRPAFLAACLEVCAQVSLGAPGAAPTTVPSKPASSTRVGNRNQPTGTCWRPGGGRSVRPPFLVERGARRAPQPRPLQIRLVTERMRITAASPAAPDHSLAFAVDGLAIERLRDGGVQVAVEAFKLSSTRCGQQRWHANFGGRFAQRPSQPCDGSRYVGQPPVEFASKAAVPVCMHYSVDFDELDFMLDPATCGLMTEIGRDLHLHLTPPLARLAERSAPPPSRPAPAALGDAYNARLAQATLDLKLQSVRVWMTDEMLPSPGAGGAVWGHGERERGGGVDKSGLAAAHDCVVVSCVGLQSSCSFSGASTPVISEVDLCVTDFGLEFGEGTGTPPAPAGAAGVS